MPQVNEFSWFFSFFFIWFILVSFLCSMSFLLGSSKYFKFSLNKYDFNFILNH